MADYYKRTTCCNRSLSRSGQWLFLASISAAIGLFATLAVLQGAWLVLPFAGLEVLVLWGALSVLRRHDGDYETIEISRGLGRLEWCRAGAHNRVEFNPDWSQVMCYRRRWRCDLALRTRGRLVSIGRLMSDDERSLMAQELNGCIRVVGV